MKIEDIEVGSAYEGNGVVRRVVGYGSTKEWISWGLEKYRLPYGGFITTRCTSAKSFAKWAERKIEKD
jgi:hypothetical protein